MLDLGLCFQSAGFIGGTAPERTELVFLVGLPRSPKWMTVARSPQKDMLEKGFLLLFSLFGGSYMRLARL